MHSSLFKITVFLTLLFIFLQDFTVRIGEQMLYVAPLFIIASLVLIITLNKKKFITHFFYLYKYTPVKYLFLLVAYMIISSFLHGGLSAVIVVIYRTVLIYGLTVIPSVLFATAYLSFTNSQVKLLKIYVISCLFILLYGAFDFLCRTIFQTEPPLYYLLCTRSYYSKLNGIWITGFQERASSIFFEPSFFATFIFLFLPLAYVLYKSKIKIIKNKKFDYIFKISLIMLFWLCLFFTKSPIYIILSTIYTIIFFRNDIIRILKKTIAIPLILTCIFAFLVFDTDIISSNITKQNKVLFRVYTVATSFGDLYSLVERDHSMATRVIATINTYQAFKKVPIFGCGYGNGSNIMYDQYVKDTKTPLTEEIIDKQIKLNKTGPSPNIFWSMLLQTGIIGTSLLYLFFIKSITTASKIQKFFIGKTQLFLIIIKNIAINYIIISFYWSLDSYPMMWFIFGILNAYILRYKLFNKFVKKIKQGE